MEFQKEIKDKDQKLSTFINNEEKKKSQLDELFLDNKKL